MERFTAAVGQALRRARRARGMTLRDLDRLSGGRFKPSSVAGYERGERSISLERFCVLAEFYGEAPDRLLGQILLAIDPDGRRELVIDLTRLATAASEEARLLDGFVRDVQASRGDHRTDVITLRSGDLAILAMASKREPAELLARLRPAIVEGGTAPRREADAGSSAARP